MGRPVVVEHEPPGLEGEPALEADRGLLVGCVLERDRLEVARIDLHALVDVLCTSRRAGSCSVLLDLAGESCPTRPSPAGILYYRRRGDNRLLSLGLGIFSRISGSVVDRVEPPLTGTGWALVAAICFGFGQLLNRKSNQLIDAYRTTFGLLVVVEALLITRALVAGDLGLLATAPLASLAAFVVATLSTSLVPGPCSH